MKIIFFSNFLNHHQLPLCKELITKVGKENFCFVACQRIEEERLKMGYEDMNKKYPFVLRAYESKENMNHAIRLAQTSDVAIIGSAPTLFAEIRSKKNKLTFLFRERIFKNGSWHRFLPTTAYVIYKDYTQYRNNNFYVLCASAYTAKDLEKCFFPSSKCLKWGYFPELLPKVEKKYDKLRIMWCGRMLWWKHPEDAIEVALILNARNIDFEMQIIGNGEKRDEIRRMIRLHGLESKVVMYDFMSPTDIRHTMSESNVYLFTSGKQEGWGVVLNEAMNSGCVVVANRNAGSTPYLIQNGVNGFIYGGSRTKLEKVVEKLLSVNLQNISDAAYRTIEQMWNPQIAAERFIGLCNTLMDNKKQKWEEGPCSSVK